MKIIFAILALASSLVFAKSVDYIEVSDSRIFLPITGAPATAGYCTIKNTSNNEVVVKIDSVLPFKAVETHETIEKDGRMSMKKVDGFIIPAKSSIVLKPGGNHIMLFEPTRDLKLDEELIVKFLVNNKSYESKFKVIPRVSKNEDHSKH